MTYTVIWTLAAVTLVGRVASAHHDPAAVDREAVWMDSILRRYPKGMGESRSGPFRLWYADILGLWYAVDDDTMTVRIISAGPARRH